jgi:molecular chaperone DnaK (HSP70)
MRKDPATVVADVIAYLKADATDRRLADVTFDQAVMTIPVAMDGRARRELRDAALRSGIRVIQFVHEPLAALYAYLRRQPDFNRAVAELEGELVLVFDWGGGTLDLTLCTITKGTLTQVANLGNDRVGGDRFDDLLRNEVRRRHAAQHNLDASFDTLPGAEAKLIEACEQTKIELSTRPSSRVFVANYLRSDDPDRTLEVVISRNELEALTRSLVDDGIGSINAILERVRREAPSVALCLTTGGMMRMPYIRERLLEIFGALRLPQVPDGDLIIAEGAAWIANDRRRLRLAKPFEILLADDSYVALVSERTDLPVEGQSHVRTFGMYCVDPRDGFARLQFARPRWPGRAQKADTRTTYATLLVAVDPTATPLLERLEVNLEIDHDLVVTVGVSSSLFEDTDQVEIHELEFGLGLTASRS